MKKQQNLLFTLSLIVCLALIGGVFAQNTTQQQASHQRLASTVLASHIAVAIDTSLAGMNLVISATNATQLQEYVTQLTQLKQQLSANLTVQELQEIKKSGVAIVLAFKNESRLVVTPQLKEQLKEQLRTSVDTIRADHKQKLDELRAQLYKKTVDDVKEKVKQKLNITDDDSLPPQLKARLENISAKFDNKQLSADAVYAIRSEMIEQLRVVQDKRLEYVKQIKELRSFNKTINKTQIKDDREKFREERKEIITDANGQVREVKTQYRTEYRTDDQNKTRSDDSRIFVDNATGAVVTQTATGDGTWCPKGAEFKIDASGFEAKAVIDGVDDYKGAIWCKAKYDATIQGIRTKTLYYFNEKQTEFWIESTSDLPSGDKTFITHLVDGKVVSQQMS
jgi:hypothetical protein